MGRAKCQAATRRGGAKIYIKESWEGPVLGTQFVYFVKVSKCHAKRLGGVTYCGMQLALSQAREADHHMGRWPDARCQRPPVASRQLSCQRRTAARRV